MYAISEDAVAPAKLFADFAKENKGITIKAGAMPGSQLDSDGVKALADMPSREKLFAYLLGTSSSREGISAKAFTPSASSRKPDRKSTRLNYSHAAITYA